MIKKTIVIGASDNPSRYSYKAVSRLLEYGHPVIPIGRRTGFIENMAIQTGKPHIQEVDTISLYLSPENQTEFYSYLLSLQPRRIIFNPGTENPELKSLCKENGIEAVEQCTLVLLSQDDF
jgi:predicted CoA-binding protein